MDALKNTMVDTVNGSRRRAGFWARGRFLYGKHRRLFKAIAIFLGVWVLLTWLGSFYEPFSPRVLLSKESADAAKNYILSFTASAVVFMALQILQVMVAPIPGQASGFAGGYVFGWQLGIIYTTIGLAIGSWIVFFLSRRFGRGFVEKLNGPEALRDFEDLFLKGEGSSPESPNVRDEVTTVPGGGVAAPRTVAKGYAAAKSHGLLTFFVIMLLPGLPDDLVCFVGGLTKIPIWQLMLAQLAGRFPGMLVLSMVGDGFSRAESNTVFLIFIGITLIFTVVYFWKKQQIEGLMRRAAGIR